MPSSLFLWVNVGLFDLMVGSFLNVVIGRLPVMLSRQWRAEALSALAMQPEEPPPLFNLVFPSSHCPKCEAHIAWHDNIPVFGWLKRRGRCANCASSISLAYPLVEFLGAAIAVATAYQYGLGGEAVFVLTACYMLLCLAMIDARTYTLPDVLTLPLLWLGLIYQLLFEVVPLEAAVLGAAGGYLIPWAIYWAFKSITGREGMGYGDFKLMAALGAWLGWSVIPDILLFSALAGLVGTLLLRLVSRGQSLTTPIPFGPYLALAGALMLLAGQPMFGELPHLLG